MKSKPSALTWAALLVATVIYAALLTTRQTIPDSDLTRVVEEFNAVGMSSYNLREPLYWAAGKFLTAILGDAWLAISALDMLSLLLIVLAFRHRSIPAVFIVALMLSPMIFLGISNIHRQLVGFCVWMAVERVTESKGPYKTALWHIIPFLVHTSMGLLSLIYYLCYAIVKKDTVVLFGIALASIITGGFFFGSLAEFFREGTDTNTSMLGYSAWAIAMGGVVFVIARKVPFILLFHTIGCIVSLGLFVISGGSSGSRFFMLVITISAIWVATRVIDRLDVNTVTRWGMIGAVSAVLVAPSMSSDFSVEIFRAALFQVPYGASY